MGKQKKTATSAMVETLIEKAMGALEIVNLLSGAAKIALMLNLTREQFVDGIAGLAGSAYDAQKHKRDHPDVPLVPPGPSEGGTDG